MESKGYRFYKSGTVFSHKEGGLDFRIGLRFDGRGGLTMLDAIELHVEAPHYNRLIKRLVGIGGVSLVSSRLNYFICNRIIVPVPYSQKALDVANTMNMSELAKIPFEEKYPTERLHRTTNETIKLLVEKAFPFFERYTTLENIYDHYVTDIGGELNPLGVYTYRRRFYANKIRLLAFLLIANDLDKPIPDVLYKYKHYYKDMDFGFGYLEKVQDLKKNLKELGVDYRPK